MDRLTKPKLSLSLPDKADPTRGGGGWPLVSDHVNYSAWRTQVFTPAELDTIIQIGNAVELEKAITNDSVQSDKTRNSFVQFLFPNELTRWIYQRMTEVILEMNDGFFGFDLTSLEQGLQFTRYTAPGQHYDWHVDRGFNSVTRKLSVSVQLSDPTDYDGGELQLKFAKKDDTIAKERGLISLFPSWTLHRVRPVTRGTRYSLVAWVSGPPFK